jgi:DNA-binding winged helix-turn-helix (wHTH) protein
MPQLLHEPTYRDDPSISDRQTGPAAAEMTLEFGRFRALLRRRQLLADGRPIELGARAFDILLVLLEADGLLVTKEELLGRVWGGRIVGENNLHAQMSALRKALGQDRGLIRTDCGRGYRLTVPVRATAAPSGWPGISRQSARADQAPLRRKAHWPGAHTWFAPSSVGWRRL